MLFSVVVVDDFGFFFLVVSFCKRGDSFCSCFFPRENFHSLLFIFTQYNSVMDFTLPTFRLMEYKLCSLCVNVLLDFSSFFFLFVERPINDSYPFVCVLYRFISFRNAVVTFCHSDYLQLIAWNMLRILHFTHHFVFGGTQQCHFMQIYKRNFQLNPATTFICELILYDNCNKFY